MIKKLLIIYNIAFFLAGHVLFTNFHYLTDHDHDPISHEKHECEECITIKNNENFIQTIYELDFIENNFTPIVSIDIPNIKVNIAQIYLSRAPPISL